MALRWTAAGMMEAAKGFRRLKAYKQLPVLKAALAAHQSKYVTQRVEQECPFSPPTLDLVNNWPCVYLRYLCRSGLAYENSKMSRRFRLLMDQALDWP